MQEELLLSWPCFPQWNAHMPSGRVLPEWRKSFSSFMLRNADKQFSSLEWEWNLCHQVFILLDRDGWRASTQAAMSSVLLKWLCFPGWLWPWNRFDDPDNGFCFSHWSLTQQWLGFLVLSVLAWVGQNKAIQYLHAMQFLIVFSPYKHVLPPVSGQRLALSAVTISFCWF